MMLYANEGEVYECVRPHLVFSASGDIVGLEKGELIIVVQSENFMTTAVRVETGEFIKTLLLEVFGTETTFTRVWP